MYFYAVQPLVDTNGNKLYMFNEAMVIVLSYTMLTFTNWVDLRTQFDMGYAFVMCLIFILFINVINIVRKTILEYFSKRRKMANQKAYEEAYKAYAEKMKADRAERRKERAEARLVYEEKLKKAMDKFGELKFDYATKKEDTKTKWNNFMNKGPRQDQNK